jgi:hypothetical protein
MRMSVGVRPILRANQPGVMPWSGKARVPTLVSFATPSSRWGIHAPGHQSKSAGGAAPSLEFVCDLSDEVQVTQNTPPGFVWSRYEDQAVPMENTMKFAAAASVWAAHNTTQANGIPGQKTDYSGSSQRDVRLIPREQSGDGCVGQVMQPDGSRHLPVRSGEPPPLWVMEPTQRDNSVGDRTLPRNPETKPGKKWL